MKNASEDASHRWIPSRADIIALGAETLEHSTAHAGCHFPMNDLGKHPVLKSGNNRYFIAAGDIDRFHFLSSKEKYVLGQEQWGMPWVMIQKKTLLSLLTCDVEFTHKQGLRELAS